ncbi:MAG: type III secretion system ATPase SctN [Candidatus Velthaea sp.]
MTGRPAGTILRTAGGLVEAIVPAMRLGEGACIRTRTGAVIPARVAAIDGPRALLAPFGPIEGIAGGDRVVCDPTVSALVLGTPLLGRACDAAGKPLDGRPAAVGLRVDVEGSAVPPGGRTAVSQIFWTGVRAIDGPLAIARGARIGLFGAPGCGKSTLLESIAAGCSADATVVALIGERGREAERWLARVDSRMTLVCATSDRSPAERLRAADVAFAQAAALCRRGLHVVLIVDSLARIAAAARDVAVALGEPVGRGGYPPSVFARIARLLERSGEFGSGSITLIATVLSDGADERDPVSEAARAALDGHIALSERLAQRGWFPAIDLPASASRTMSAVASGEHRSAAQTLRAAVVSLAETREARQFGLDVGAGNPALARALAAETAIEHFLRQGGEYSAPHAMLTELTGLADRLK